MKRGRESIDGTAEPQVEPDLSPAVLPIELSLASSSCLASVFKHADEEAMFKRTRLHALLRGSLKSYNLITALFATKNKSIRGCTRTINRLFCAWRVRTASS